MSTYPGHDPHADEPRDQGAPIDPGQRHDDEPTAPITPSGPAFDQSAGHAGAQHPGQAPRDTPPQQPSGWQVPQPTTPYAQTVPPPPPGYGPPPPHPGYGQPGPYGGGWAPPAPDHPQATTAMVLGIIGLAGGFTVLCGIGFLVSPFAWAIGRSALRDIEASQGRYGGAAQARTGLYTGIAGTVLLVLALLAIVVVVVVAIATSASGGSEI